MKKLLSLSVTAISAALLMIGCESAAQQAVNSNGAADNSVIVSSHATDANVIQPTPISPNASTGESSPMAKPIDVGVMTAAIEKSEIIYKKNPKDDKAAKNLAKAYFERAFALTEAAQYRAALGDFRKGLKLDPNDEAARKMHDEILRIFQSINREPPKEGEEPTPMQIEAPTATAPHSSTEKIKFAAGATSAIVTGNLNSYTDFKRFLITVKEGQTLRTEQIKDADSKQDTTVVISDAKGAYVGDSDASCNNKKEIKPTAAGEYQISVTECVKADPWRGQFKLKVSVE